MGFQDRGGGREGKNTSLRKNKKNAAAEAKKALNGTSAPANTAISHGRWNAACIIAFTCVICICNCSYTLLPLADKPKADVPLVSPPAPPVITLNAQGKPINKPLSIDAVANLVSRQFDRDREAVLRRARDVRLATRIASHNII